MLREVPLDAGATGMAPARIAVVGESAGGGLALAALVAARDAGLSQPSGGLAVLALARPGPVRREHGGKGRGD